MEPIGLMNAHGADAVRWFFAASGSPWSARRIGPSVLDEIVRKVLLTYWNTVSFLVLYANASSSGAPAWVPEDGLSAPAPQHRPLIDRWLLSELHACVRDVTASLEAFDTAGAGRRLSVLIDDLSNWYVRRSRRRFWDGPASSDGASAFATLHEVLLTLTKLMAPITPFLADYVWGVLRRADDPESVHLSSWPAYSDELIDESLSARMALARRLVELGRSARSAASVRTRQPLSRALVGASGFGSLHGELRALVAEELNVHSLEPLDAAGGELVTYTVKPQFRSLGRRFGASTQAVAAAIGAADPALLAQAVESGTASVEVPSLGAVELTGDDVIVTQTPLEGWGVATAGGETVALDLTVTPALRAEGWAREVVRLVQDARKSDGLDVTDRIALRWSAADPDLAAALNSYRDMIAGEVLAVEFGPDAGTGTAQTGAAGAAGTAGVAGAEASWHEHSDDDLGLRFWLAMVSPA
jgi:isoleucyl-tRNA synthetase